MVTAKKASTPKPLAAAAPAVAKPVAARKPAVKKSATPAAPATVTVAPAKVTAAAKPKAAKPAAETRSKSALSSEQRNHYVEVAAFYIAERRGFIPGNPADDWCAAELEVDRLIASGHFN